MILRKSLAVALAFASIGAITLPMAANAAVTVYLNSAPPPLRVEAVPAPRHGYVWSAGHWNAKNNQHVWQAGHWEKERPGYHFVQPTWKEQNRWEYHGGRWNKGDRDGDGVPNSVDRRPDNPNKS
jgi:hypothetical protein